MENINAGDTPVAEHPVTRRQFLLGVGAVAVAGAASGGLPGKTLLGSGQRSQRSAAKKGGKISVLTLGGGIFGLPYLHLTPQFEKDTGITVNLVQEGALQSNAESAAIAASHNSAYDVLQIDLSILAGFAAGHLFKPIEDYIPSSFMKSYVADVYPVWMDVMTYKGTVWGLPTEANSEQGQVNSKYLKELGLKVPQTWDELLSGAQKVVKAKKGIYGFDGNMQSTTYAVATWLPIFWGNGGVLWDEAYEPQFTSKVALDSLELLLELAATMPPGGASYIEAQETKAMAGGLCTYNPDGWIPDPFTTSTEPVKSELAGLPMPSGTKRPAPVLGGLGLCISNYSKNPELAAEYIKYFNSESVQVEIAKAGGQPVRNSAWTKVLHLQPWFPTVFHNLKYAVERPKISQWADIQSTVGVTFSQAFVGQLSAKKALEQAQNETVSILRKAGLLKK